MQIDAKGFRWDTRRRRAAVLLAENERSPGEVADDVGVHIATLWRWRQHPDFQTHVIEIERELEAVTIRYAVAKRRHRVKALNDRWNRMHAVIEARAEEYAEIPGGLTGLLVRQRKAIGVGRNQQIIEEYAVDTGLLKELREHEKQAAQELGQWAEKHEHTGADGGPMEVAGIEFDFAAYQQAFSALVVHGASAGVSPENGAHESLDTAHANGKASGIPESSSS